MFPQLMWLGLLLVVLFWKVVETLGDEIGHWGECPQSYFILGRFLFPSILFLFTMM
jgi:hypothetical protein